MADLDHLHVSFQSLQQAEMEAQRLYGPQADISKRIVPYLKNGILHFEARQKGFLWGMKSISRQFAGREGVETGQKAILSALGRLTAQEQQANPKLQGLISRTALAAEHIFGKKALSGQARLQEFAAQNTRAQTTRPHEEARKALETETDRLVEKLRIRDQGNFLPPGQTATLAQYRERVKKEAFQILSKTINPNTICTILHLLSVLSQEGNSLAKDLWQALKTVDTYQMFFMVLEEIENQDKEKLATDLIALQETCPLLFRRPVARISPLTHPSVRHELEELDKIEHMPKAELENLVKNGSASPARKARAQAALEHENETLEKLKEAKQKAQTYGEFQEQVVEILHLRSRSEKELEAMKRALRDVPSCFGLVTAIKTLLVSGQKEKQEIKEVLEGLQQASVGINEEQTFGTRELTREQLKTVFHNATQLNREEDKAWLKKASQALRALSPSNSVAREIIQFLEEFQGHQQKEVQQQALLQQDAQALAQTFLVSSDSISDPQPDENLRMYEQRLLAQFEEKLSKMPYQALQEKQRALQDTPEKPIQQAIKRKIGTLIQDQNNAIAKWDRILSMLPEGSRKTLVLQSKTFISQTTTPQVFRAFDNSMKTQLLQSCSLQELQAFLQKVEDSPEEKTLAPLSQAVRSFVRSCENARTGWTLLSSFLKKHGKDILEPLEIEPETTPQSLLLKVQAAKLKDKLQSIPVGERKPIIDELLRTFAPGDPIGEEILSALRTQPNPPASSNQ